MRRMSTDSGGSVNWLIWSRISARRSASGRSPLRSRAARRSVEKRRSPGTAYHRIARRISRSASSASTRVGAVGGM